MIDYYGLVEHFHDEVPKEFLKFSSGLFQKALNFFHSREYISDYIANMYFGPVFYESLYEYVYVNQIKRGGTHPPWESRLFFLQTKVPSNKEKRVSSPDSKENHTITEKLDDMVLLTIESVFHKKSSIYKEVDTELSKAAHDLQNLLLYVESPRTTLNAYHEHHDDIMNYLKKRGDTPTILENKLGLIIEDSIRLSNMRKTFRLMVDGFSDS